MWNVTRERERERMGKRGRDGSWLCQWIVVAVTENDFGHLLRFFVKLRAAASLGRLDFLIACSFDYL
jgi:hypothetical protein